MNHESGKFKGALSVSGGSVAPRCALYRVTMTAIRYNPKIKAYYQSLIGRGKEKKVSLVACMKKFLVTLNAIIRDSKVIEDQQLT